MTSSVDNLTYAIRSGEAATQIPKRVANSAKPPWL